MSNELTADERTVMDLILEEAAVAAEVDLPVNTAGVPASVSDDRVNELAVQVAVAIRALKSNAGA